MIIERASALTESEFEALGLLTGDVFGVDQLSLEWRRKTDHFVIRDGSDPVCRVGVVHEINTVVDSTTIRLAGIGGVVTIPEYQGQGLAARLLRHALNTLTKDGYQFAGLFCLDRLAPYYARQGWLLIDEREVEILQSEGYIESPLNFMTIALADARWPDGNVRIEQRIW